MRKTSVLAAALAIGLAGPFAAAPALAEIVGEAFVYDVDGGAFEGYVARNTNIPSSRGTVLIIHDWDGLTDYEMRRADMLAAEGYTAFAIDVYGQGVRPTTIDENRRLAGSMYGDRETFRKRLLGALAAVPGMPGATEDVVVLGYCFGGAAVLEMARAGAATEGFVSFHGGLGLPEGQSYAGVTAPVLVLHGSADPVSGMADVAALMDQLQAAGVPHEARIFGGARHSFTVYGSGDYDLAADRGSWHALLAFLEQRLD